MRKKQVGWPIYERGFLERIRELSNCIVQANKTWGVPNKITSYQTTEYCNNMS